MPADLPAHPFWDFSLDVYGRNGVAPACLELQDRHGIDVNVLLYCLWLGEQGVESGETRFDAALAAVREWHIEVVRSLRAIRRRLKTPIGGISPAFAQPLRARVQKTEIEAEHNEQLTLAALGPVAAGKSGFDAAGRAALALGWLERYVAQLGLRFDDADWSAIIAIWSACFGSDATAVAGAGRTAR
jgi:uncharacterized protein (TIGR02444 family)